MRGPFRIEIVSQGVEVTYLGVEGMPQIGMQITGAGHTLVADQVAASREMAAELRHVLDLVRVDGHSPTTLRQQMITAAGRIRTLLEAAGIETELADD